MESPRRGAFGGRTSGRAAADAARMHEGESEVSPPESSAPQLQDRDAFEPAPTAASLRQTALASKPSQEAIEAEFARALESDGNSTAAHRVRNHQEGPLELSNTRLARLPKEIGHLASLQALALHDNLLTSLPPEMGNLSALNELLLSNNYLASLPAELGNLTVLKRLDLGNNYLTSLPPEMGNLTALNSLWLDNNRLTSLPTEMGNLADLHSLDLDNNQLTSLPASIANLRNLRVLNLRGNPIAARGENESSWGREELRRHFDDRVVFNEPSAALMPAGTTQADVLSALDRQPVRINRKQLQAARVPEITTPTIEDGDAFLEEFAKLYSNLNFNQPDKPGYLSYEQLAGDWSSDGSADKRSNDEKVLHRVIPKLTGYFKTLYNMPLDQVERDSGSWQMYDDKVPALKKALSYVIPAINDLEDSDQRAILFQQFVDGMLHCPTGQSEGIDTVVNALQGGRIARSSDLTEVFRKIIALRKNSGFKTAVLSKAASNSQNVHVISKYQNALREELGLDNVLAFDEKMGTMGVDPFNGNPWNVLKTFYDLVTPQRMVDWIMERTPSSDDLNQKQKLRDLQKQRAAASSSSAPAMRALREELEVQKAELNNPALSAEEAEVIQARVQQLEGLLGITAGASTSLDKEGIQDLDAKILALKNQIHQTHAFKPLEPQDVVQYLQDTNQINPDDNPDWWRGYFSADPEIDASAVLTREGALKLLQHLGYVTRE